MIIYYSGTGNSRYVAKKLAKHLDEKIVNFTEIYRANEKIDLSDEERIIFVYPTYGGRMPVFMMNYLYHQTYKSGTKAYFVTSCGASGGNQYKNLQCFCKKLSLEFMNFYWVVMPENYIALFSAPSEEKAQAIIEKATPTIERIAEKIKNQEKAKIITGFEKSIYNDLFYKFYVKAEKFYSTDACVGCEKCASVCVMNNITLSQKHRPEWKDGCTHCMACISVCPQRAIEYGKVTKNKRRYYLADEE